MCSEIFVPLDALEGRNGCCHCDGFGIMRLDMGRPESVEMPCVVCSGDQNIYMLVQRRDAAIRDYLRKKERLEIAAHNARMADLEARGQ